MTTQTGPKPRFDIEKCIFELNEGVVNGRLISITHEKDATHEIKHEFKLTTFATTGPAGRGPYEDQDALYHLAYFSNDRFWLLWTHTGKSWIKIINPIFTETRGCLELRYNYLKDGHPQAIFI